jgi:uncharacterized protein
MKTLQSYWFVIWRSIIFFLLWGIFYAVFIVPFNSSLKAIELVQPIVPKLFYDSTGALTVCLAAWLMVRFIDKRSFTSLGILPRNAFRDMGLGIILGILWLAVSLGIAWAAGFVSMQAASISYSWLFGIGFSVLFNAFAQEVLVRSYLYQTIRSRSNPAWAIFLTSMLFSVLHIGAFKGALLPAVNVFGAGILFALVYQFTGNVWMPTGIHFAWNYLMDPVLGLGVSAQNPWGTHWHLAEINGPELWIGGSFGLEGGLIVSATILITIGLLLSLYKKKIPELWVSFRDE